MANQITGRIVAIAPIEVITTTKGEFKKRELTIDATRFDPYTGERDRFESFPTFEFGGDGCTMLDEYSVGDVVTVSFEVSGVKYQDKETKLIRYFNRVRGYKVELKKKHEAQQDKPVSDYVPVGVPESNVKGGDLPF